MCLLMDIQAVSPIGDGKELTYLLAGAAQATPYVLLPYFPTSLLLYFPTFHLRSCGATADKPDFPTSLLHHFPTCHPPGYSRSSPGRFLLRSTHQPLRP